MMTALTRACRPGSFCSRYFMRTLVKMRNRSFCFFMASWVVIADSDADADAPEEEDAIPPGCCCCGYWPEEEGPGRDDEVDDMDDDIDTPADPVGYDDEAEDEPDVREYCADPDPDGAALRFIIICC